MMLRYVLPEIYVVRAVTTLLWACDVSVGHGFSETFSWIGAALKHCLKRPSFNCLIHFYKRCVSSLAQMGRSP